MELGRQLRSLYVDRLSFMPSQLASGSVLHLRSTRYQRTFVSLQHLFRGLYPPACVNGRLEDVLVAVADPRHETLLPPEDHDERFAALLQEFSRRAAIKWNGSPEMRLVNTQIARWMPGAMPVSVDSQPLKLHGVLDTIAAVAATPRPEEFLPRALLDPGLRAVMEKICAEEEFAGYVYSNEFRRLGVGSILWEAIRRMTAAMHRAAGGHDSDSRMCIYACHDSTLAGIMASLGAMQDPGWFWPPYTAHLTMELFRYVGDEGGAHGELAKETTLTHGSWVVRLNYQGQPLVLPRCAQADSHLPGFEGVYSFEALRDMISEFAPEEGPCHVDIAHLKKITRI